MPLIAFGCLMFWDGLAGTGDQESLSGGVLWTVIGGSVGAWALDQY